MISASERRIPADGRFLFVLFFTLLFVNLCASADVIYVDQDAVGGLNNGSSWQDAYLDLQFALLDAGAGDEIWVAQGVYTPDPAIREVSFNLRDQVAVYGGFAGTEDDRSQRSYKMHPTVLSGDLLGNDGPNFQNYDDNSLHVVYANNLVSNWAVLDGFTVTAGNANNVPPGSSNDRGAGVLVNGAQGVIITARGKSHKTRCLPA